MSLTEPRDRNAYQEDLRARLRDFVTNHCLPLEPAVLRREPAASSRVEAFPAQPGMHYRCDPWGDLTAAEHDELLRLAREYGLWGIDIPEHLGGQGLGTAAKVIAIEEMARTIVPFVLPPDSPNVHWLLESADAAQREKYLAPLASGLLTSAIAVTEPSAGSDVHGIKTTALRVGSAWRLSGTKRWIGKADWADVIIVVARTGATRSGSPELTAFLVDRGTPGVRVTRRLPTLANYRPCEITFDNVELKDEAVLGDVGSAFAPLRKRFSVRRLEIAARCVGVMDRCLSTLVNHARTRSTFGLPLSERQLIQSWIADAALGVYTTRLMVTDIAARLDAGDDVRIEAAAAKVLASEAASAVVDHSIQAHGASGLSKEMPLEHYLRLVRSWRIVEGPSEVHRVSIARTVLRDLSTRDESATA